jgi:hypothetical protein
VKRWVLALCALLLGAGGGAAVGAYWTVTTEHEICERIETECGDAAMPMDDCLNGRQSDLLRYGVRALRRVSACLASAPHDCLSVSACVCAVEP